jgi:hypothetical protein
LNRCKGVNPIFKKKPTKNENHIIIKKNQFSNIRKLKLVWVKNSINNHSDEPNKNKIFIIEYKINTELKKVTQY